MSAAAPRTENARAAPSRRLATGLSAALLALLLLAPAALSSFELFQLTQLLIWALAILGLTLLTGVSGQFSLGHGAFFALGAYAAAILAGDLGLPYPLALLAATLIATTVGGAIGYPASRLDGVYLGLATFALAVATPQILKLRVVADWTGGTQGRLVDRPAPPEGLAALAERAGLSLSGDAWFYLLTIALALGAYAGLRALLASRTGRAMLAIRENPLAARAMGVDVAGYKALAFALSAALTGLAGAQSAFVVGFLAPDSFTFHLSVALLVGLVVGGAAWPAGALLGGAFVLLIPNFAEEIWKGLSWAIYGVILIAFVFLAPEGVGGWAARVAAWLDARARGDARRRSPDAPRKGSPP